MFNSQLSQSPDDYIPGRTYPLAQIQPTDRTGIIHDYLASLSARTKEAYLADYRDFATFTGHSAVKNAIEALVGCDRGSANVMTMSYKASLVERHLSPASINRRLAAVRTAVRLYRSAGYINFELDVKNAKSEPYRDTKGPGLLGVAALFDLAAKGRNRQKAIRDVAILRLLYGMGLRCGEAVALDLADFDREAGTLAVMGKGKTQKQSLSVPTKALQALTNWIEIRGNAPGALLTNFDRARKGDRLTGGSVWEIVKRLGAQAGFKARPHGLRHAVITEALNKTNGDYRKVRAFSRHKSIQTVMLYDDHRQDFGGQVAELVDGAI